jgi:hypothetical protein
VPHRRDEIRKILIDALKNKTLAKDHVFNWRIRPVQQEHSLPCISIVIPEERALEISAAGDLIHRQADVYLVIYSTLSNHEENISDEIARQIEGILNKFNLKEFNFQYKKMEISTENLSSKILILTSLQYECSYFTKETQQIDGENFEKLSIEVV